MPDALREIIGKREIWISYGPVSFAKAKAMHHAQMARVERQFADARRSLQAGTAAPAVALVAPTLDVATALIKRWFRQEEIRRLAEPMPDDPRTVDAILEHFRDDEVHLSGEDGRQIAERMLPGIFAATPFSAPAGEVRRLAVRLVQSALVEGVLRDRQRHERVPETFHDEAFASITAFSPPPREPKAGLTFGDLIDQYLARAERTGRSPKTVLKYKGFARVLKEIVGETKAATAVDRAECRRAQDVLRSLPANAIKRWPGLSAPKAAEKAQAEGIEPMHPNSVGNHIDFLASVFKFAVEEQLVEKNPAKRLEGSAPKGVTAPANGEKRRAFTLGELRLIFSAPLYVGCKDDENGYAMPGPNRPRRGRFWVPLVGLWTGMRLNEICQLGVADVEAVEGVPLIHVRAVAEGARLKTAAAVRRIPLHPELVRLGFLQHVAKMRERGETRLFPDVPVGEMGTYADPFSKWFGRFLTKAGVAAPGAVFHSFRHGWRTRFRDTDGVSIETVNTLGGWTNPGEGAGYGDAGSVAKLAEHVAKIAYPGLDLSHLHASGPAGEGGTGVRHRPPPPRRTGG